LQELVYKIRASKNRGGVSSWVGKFEMGKCQILDWLFGIATKKELLPTVPK